MNMRLTISTLFFAAAFALSCNACSDDGPATPSEDTSDQQDNGDSGDTDVCAPFTQTTEICRDSSCDPMGFMPMFADKLTGGAQQQVVEAVYSEADGGRWFVVSQTGVVTTLTADGAATESVDIGGQLWTGHSEAGLLGLALPPNFPENNEVYLSYTGGDQDSIVSRMTVDTTDWTFDDESEEELLRVSQPAGNHNGGKIAFGPDGYLYISWGDGGGANNQFDNGQNKDTLLGTIMRIDVTSEETEEGKPYAIPDDNPFVGEEGADEIYAYGLRNVWKFSFDADDGRLFAADVGQSDFEEVNIIVNGGNYGWSLKEGFSCFDADEPCDDLDVIDPIWDYSHEEGASITGGYVYRGDEIPALQGRYVVSDYTNGKIWHLTDNGEIPWDDEMFLQANFAVSGFTEGPNNELYIFNYRFDEGPAIYKFASVPEECLP
jgi:glucose/arabinose dehydrogenase